MSDNVEGNAAVSATHDGTTPPEGSLSELQQQVYNALLPFITGDDSENGSLGYLFAGLQDVLEDIRDDFAGNLPGSDMLAGAGGGKGGGLLGGSSTGGFPSKPIKISAKEKPSIANMMELPVEFSMGYLLLYWKLDEMQKGQLGASESKKKSGGGIGGFFSGLLKGAEGLALIAIALIAFAGAMILFQFIQWEPALKGLVAFGIFVVAMTLIAKTLGNNMKDFETFAKGVLLMTIGIILFNVAIWVSAKIVPYWPAAKQTIIAFGIFVGTMVIVASLLGDNLASFQKFAVGVLIMTAAIILFDIAIFVTWLIEPFVPGALAGLKLFGVFVAGAVVLALLVASTGPLFILFAVGILVLVGALLLFGYTIHYFSKLGPAIPPAINAARDSLGLITVIGEFVGKGLDVIGQVFLFGVALTVLSAAFLFWGLALLVMSGISFLLPRARTGIEDSIKIFEAIATMAAASIGPIAAAVVFGVSLAVVAAAFILWGGALVVMGLVNKFIPKAREGILATIEILGQIGAVGLKAVIMFIPVIAFAGQLAIVAAAFILWGLALGAMGGILTAMPKAFDGIRATMDILAQIGAMGLRAVLMLVPVIAFAAQLATVSAAFILWGAALAIIGGLAGKAVASSASIGIILTTFQMISNSIKSGTMKNVHEFADGLSKLSDSMKKLTSGSTGLDAIASSLDRISRVDLSSAFKPLIELTTHQKGIDTLAQSLERISKAIKPPSKTIWDTINNLTGGNVANPQAQSGEGVERKKDIGPSVMEKLLSEIRDHIVRWDGPIEAMGKGGGGQATTFNYLSSSGVVGSPQDVYSVHGPLSPLG